MNNLIDLISAAEKCNYRKQGGEISERELCQFWLITQKLSDSLPDFVAQIYPSEPGRVNNIDSPYTMASCICNLIPEYKVERIDSEIAKAKPRIRAGVRIQLLVPNIKAYERAFLATNKLDMKLTLEFTDLKGHRVMDVWIDLD